MGKFQGIRLTTDLRSLTAKVLQLPQSPDCSVSEDGVKNDVHLTLTAAVSCSASASGPAASLVRAKEARRALASSSRSLPVKDARSMVEKSLNFSNSKDGLKGECDASFLPLAGVHALKILINNSTSEQNKKEELLAQLESALRKSCLSFHTKNNKNTSTNATTKNKSEGGENEEEEETPFQKRMNRLRLLDEEKSYIRLTTNLKDARSLQDDNVTAKSMMYATSVGLNMVVAPISFGVFMYFFAGSLLSRFFGDGGEERRAGETDIRRVIAGVVSGVFMLFVEMILFVIRSHELDSSVRKKAKRKENRANPFGYTERTAARIYDRDD